MRDYLAMLGKEILLGKRGENNHLRVVFDISNWRKVYGDGEVALLHQRSGDKAPYPCSVEQNGDRVSWTVTAADVEMAGRGKAELQYIVGDTCVKSDIYTTFADRGVDTTGAEPGRPEASWVSKVLRVERNAENARRDIENMTVTGDMVPHDSTEPTVEKSKNPDGTVNLHFNVRMGAKAAYVGSDECPPGYNIQVDPSGEADTNGVVEMVLEEIQPVLDSVDNVFIATYGATTYEELEAAYNAGKALVCRYGSTEFQFGYIGMTYSPYDITDFVFYCVSHYSVTTCSCGKDGWSMPLASHIPNKAEVDDLEDRVTYLEENGGGGGDVPSIDEIVEEVLDALPTWDGGEF